MQNYSMVSVLKEVLPCKTQAQSTGDSTKESGEASSDVNCSFILPYLSEFVPCPTPPWLVY